MYVCMFAEVGGDGGHREEGGQADIALADAAGPST